MRRYLIFTQGCKLVSTWCISEQLAFHLPPLSYAGCGRVGIACACCTSAFAFLSGLANEAAAMEDETAVKKEEEDSDTGSDDPEGATGKRKSGKGGKA